MWGFTVVAVVLVAGMCFATDSERRGAAPGAERPELPSYLAHGWNWSGGDIPLWDPKTAAAQYNRGVMHATGQGQPHDDREAVKWFRMAALGGHVLAQCNLGIMFATGRGVPQNKVQAWILFHVAAARGDDKAQTNKDLLAASMTRDELERARKAAQNALQENGAGLLLD